MPASTSAPPGLTKCFAEYILIVSRDGADPEVDTRRCLRFQPMFALQWAKKIGGLALTPYAIGMWFAEMPDQKGFLLLVRKAA